MNQNSVAIRYNGDNERIHAKGAEEFGGLWLGANHAVITKVGNRIDISDQAAKELIALVILHTLYSARRASPQTL